jgi:hypothetical protein
LKAENFQVSLNSGHIDGRDAHLRKVKLGSKMKFVLANAKAGLALLAALVTVCAGEMAVAQQAALSPEELVRQTVANELAAGQSDAKVMFLDRKATLRGAQTKLIVETKEGNAGMVVAENDQALTPAKLQAEQSHLARLMNNPDELRKKQRTEKEDEERVARIVKALPDAFLYEADGSQTGSGEIGKAGTELVRLKFRPNPKYEPPSRLEQVLTGLEGHMLVDAQQHRLALIDGSLNKEVSFGWGFLGHLDKGGHFLVAQADVLDGNWEITRMSLNFTGRILLVKSLNIKSDEVASGFRRVPSNLSFARGVELLKAQATEMAARRADTGGTGADSSKRY